MRPVHPDSPHLLLYALRALEAHSTLIAPLCPSCHLLRASLRLILPPSLFPNLVLHYTYLSFTLLIIVYRVHLFTSSLTLRVPYICRSLSFFPHRSHFYLLLALHLYYLCHYSPSLYTVVAFVLFYGPLDKLTLLPAHCSLPTHTI